MSDSWGDGWDGSTVTAQVNGSTVASGTVLLSSAALTFEACTGDNISISYSTGFGAWENEISYNLSLNGNTIYSSGIFPSTGVSYSGTADCDLEFEAPPTACAGMSPICTDDGLSFTASSNGGLASNLDPGNIYNCLTTTPNPTWYYLEIDDSGNIDMNLNAPADIDFIIWGPFDDLANAQGACGNLGQAPTASNGSVIDCSYSPTEDEYPSILNAQTGDVYVMLITNYASVVQNITLQQIGGTGSTNCNILCEQEPEYEVLEISCFNGCNGGIIIEGTGLAPFDYSLENSVDNSVISTVTDSSVEQTFNNLCTGQYTIYVTDSDDCTSDVSFQLENPEDLAPEYEVLEILCFNACNGGVIIEGTGLAPFDYSLENSIDNSVISTVTDSSIEQTFSDLCAGQYTIYITDSSDCTSEVSFQLNNPDDLTGLTEDINGCEFIEYMGNTYFTSQTVVSNLTTVNGCDSIITAEITVSPVMTSVVNASICNGETYTEGSSNYTVAGTYEDIYTSSLDCDSIVITNLVVSQPIVDVSIDSELPWRICADEEITLDGSPTVFAEGTSLASFTWDFGDTTSDEVSWPEVSHSYSEAGAYIIQLVVSDDNGCNSDNTIDVLVEVSTTPSFEGTSHDVLACLGSEVSLEGLVTPTEWTTTASSSFGGALFIPDDQTQCFTSEILVAGFLSDQEVTQESDLLDLFINFEHSYMGDLEVTFLCPNGQSLLVHSNQGAGTFLGEPVDDDGTPNAEGVGYDYYWAPDATLGTWGEESGGTLASGVYSSESPWSNLIGCPLNGMWSVEICDNLFSDNGFIFDWSLTFDPSLYPDDSSFTPSIGADCDSTFWTVNDGPINTLEDCNDMVTEYTEAGDYLYTFHAIDSYGCEYTTDVNVEVSELIVSVEEDFSICPEQLISMNSSVEFNNSVLPNIIYEWTPGDFLTADDDVNPDVFDVTETTEYTFTAYPDGFPECASSTDVTISLLDGPVASINATEWCPGDESNLSAVNFNLLDSVNWARESPDGSLEGLGNEPSLLTTEGGTFILTAFGCGIQDTDILFVQEESCDVFIPNIFTPNGDEFNNTFQMEGIEFQENAHLVVYNRWGGIVFEDAKYDGLWEPGRGDDDISVGTYFYVLKLESGEVHEGTITILR